MCNVRLLSSNLTHSKKQHCWPSVLGQSELTLTLGQLAEFQRQRQWNSARLTVMPALAVKLEMAIKNIKRESALYANNLVTTRLIPLKEKTKVQKTCRRGNE